MTSFYWDRQALHWVEASEDFVQLSRRLPQEGCFTTFILFPKKEMLENRKSLAAHFKRLEMACQYFALSCPWADSSAFRQALTNLQEDLNGHSVSCRILITEKYVQALLRPLPEHKPVRCTLIQYERPDSMYKHLGLLQEGQYLETARSQGFDDFIRLNFRNELVEASYTNLWLIRNGQVITPPVSSNCLPGIARQVLLSLPGSGVSIQQETLKVPELLEAEAVFLSNCVRGLIPVCSVKVGTETITFSTETNPAYQQISLCLQARNTL